MTAIHPPRVAEAILESFGADADFRDAILGDLAQEHADRAERYGQRAARLWYYREAFLASAHLLRNWFAGARWADAGRLLNVAGLAWVMTTLINLLLFFAVATVGTTLLPKPAWTSLVSMGAVVLAIAAPMCVGYLAAVFEESRPMIAAVSAAVLWAMFQAAAAIYVVIAPDIRVDLSMLARATTVPVLMALCVFGGALRVRTVSAHRAAAASSRPS